MEKVVVVNLAKVKKGTQRQELNKFGEGVVLVGDFSELTVTELHDLLELDRVVGLYLWGRGSDAIQNTIMSISPVKARMDLDRIVEVCEAFERQQKPIKYCIIGAVPESEDAEKQIKEVIGDAFTSKIMGLSHRPELLIDFEYNDFKYQLGKNEESYNATKEYILKSTQYFKPKAAVMVKSLEYTNRDLASLSMTGHVPIEDFEIAHGYMDNGTVRLMLQAIPHVNK